MSSQVWEDLLPCPVVRAGWDRDPHHGGRKRRGSSFALRSPCHSSLVKPQQAPDCCGTWDVFVERPTDAWPLLSVVPLADLGDRKWSNVLWRPSSEPSRLCLSCPREPKEVTPGFLFICIHLFLVFSSEGWAEIFTKINYGFLEIKANLFTYLLYLSVNSTLTLRFKPPMVLPKYSYVPERVSHPR